MEQNRASTSFIAPQVGHTRGRAAPQVAHWRAKSSLEAEHSRQLMAMASLQAQGAPDDSEPSRGLGSQNRTGSYQAPTGSFLHDSNDGWSTHVPSLNTTLSPPGWGAVWVPPRHAISCPTTLTGVPHPPRAPRPPRLARPGLGFSLPLAPVTLVAWASRPTAGDREVGVSAGQQRRERLRGATVRPVAGTARRVRRGCGHRPRARIPTRRLSINVRSCGRQQSRSFTARAGSSVCRPQHFTRQAGCT